MAGNLYAQEQDLRSTWQVEYERACLPGLMDERDFDEGK